MKRYNLILPDDLYAKVETLALQRHTTVAEIIRRSIKVGLMAAKAEDDPCVKLILREGNRERELILI